MVDFTKALDVKVDEVERPPLAPVGHYIFKVSKQPTFSEIGKSSKWDVVDFPLQAMEAQADVDPEELQAVGGPGNVRTRQRFMFSKAGDDEAEANNKRTLFNVRRFLEEHLGMDIEGMTMREGIDQSVNHQCMGNIQHRPNPDDPDIVYAELGRTAPADTEIE